MEHLSEKKKKNVQLAEVKTQSEDEKPQEEEVQVSLPFDLEPKLVKRAESFGIPMEQILQWMGSVEYRFQLLAKNLEKAPEQVVSLLKKEAEKTRQQRIERLQQGQEQSQPRTRGDIGELAEILRTAGIGGGGGSMNDEMLKLTKEMMSLNIQRMKQDMSFTDAIKNAIVLKISGKAASDLVG